MNEMRFNIVFKRGHSIVMTIEGQRAIALEDLTLSEVTQDIIKTEQFLEKLTGMRVHIEQVA